MQSEISMSIHVFNFFRRYDRSMYFDIPIAIPARSGNGSRMFPSWKCKFLSKKLNQDGFVCNLFLLKMNHIMSKDK